MTRIIQESWQGPDEEHNSRIRSSLDINKVKDSANPFLEYLIQWTLKDIAGSARPSPSIIPLEPEKPVDTSPDTEDDEDDEPIGSIFD